MEAPPLEAGGVKLTAAWLAPAVALTAVGAPGTVEGVTLFDAAEVGLVPFALTAFTVNV